MALETGTYISDLVPTNPVGATDTKAQGDDHIRLIKSTLQATFPNITGAMTATHTELNILDGATLSTAELNILDGVTLTASQINDAAQLSVANVFSATQFAGAGIKVTGSGAFTGTGPEVEASGGDAYFSGYNRTGAAWIDTYLRGLDVYIYAGGGQRAFFASDGSEIQLDATLLDLNGAMDLSGQGVFNYSYNAGEGAIKVTAALPLIDLYESDEGADGKRWRVVSNGGTFSIEASADNGTSGTQAVNILRTGTTVDEIELNATTLDLNGAADISGNLVVNGTSGVRMIADNAQTWWEESDASANNGKWQMRANNEEFSLFIVNDAEDTFTEIFEIQRTNQTIDSFTLNGPIISAGGLNAVPESRNITASGNTATTDNGIVVRMTSGSGATFTLDGDPPTDAVVLLDNSSGNSWTIAASGTLIWALTAGTGNRTLADDGLAVAIHRGSGVWVISGGGLS